MFKYLKTKYDFSELKVLSEESNIIHYEQHYKKYIDNTNKIISKFQDSISDTLEEVVIKSFKYNLYQDNNLFNNSAQAWNHEFFWKGLTPYENRKELIDNIELSNLIRENFESIELFKELVIEKAMSHFGSGWLWLVKDLKGNLKVITTSNAQNPLILDELTPLFCIDLWEHAYYLQFQSDKRSFIKDCLQIIDWNFVFRNIWNYNGGKALI